MRNGGGKDGGNCGGRFRAVLEWFWVQIFFLGKQN